MRLPGFSPALGVKLASSLLMTLKSSTGSGRPDASETSTRCDQHPGALDVAQKLHSQSRAEMRALDQARHVGHDERLLVRLLAHRHHAQVRLERREWIIGNLRPSGRDARNQRRLAGVGIARPAPRPPAVSVPAGTPLLPGPPQLVLARRLVGAGGKVLVPAAAAPALGHNQALVRL